MTRALETESHDTATDSTAPAVVDEEALDSIFTWQELARLDEALTMSSRETGLRFTLYVGDLGTRTRVLAVLSMTTSFAGGDLVGGIVNGLRQMSDQAGRLRHRATH